MLRKIPKMKLQNSNTISAFGGINFVFKYLEEGNYNDLFNKYFPSLAHQSIYSWKDIIYSINLPKMFCQRTMTIILYSKKLLIFGLSVRVKNVRNLLESWLKLGIK